MTESKFVLDKLTPERLNATQIAWRKFLSKNKEVLLASEFERILGWAAENACYEKDNEVFSYGIFRDSEKAALAIAEVLYSRSGRRWLKMLNLHLAPQLDLAFNEESPDVAAIAGVFSEAIIGTLRLTKVHPSSTVKLYARSQSLLSFFKGLAAHLQAVGKAPIKVSIEGRWMVING